MNRRFDRAILLSTLSLRGRMLTALNTASIKELAVSAAELRSLIAELKSVAGQTAGLPESRAIRRLSEAMLICFYVARWVRATSRAEMDADRFLNAAQVRAHA